MATIDNLSIQLNANAEAAIATINRTASSAERLRGAVQGAAGGMQSAAQGAQDMGSSTAQAGEQTEKTRKSLHGFWNALKQSGSYMGGAFLGGMKGIVGALGSMASGLLRIAKFRIYRTIIKDLGQSFKDLYGWSKMFGSEYANSMDRINSSFVYLRNSIASAAAPLFNALAPVLDAIIDKIVTLLNWLNQLFSALSGASTYTVAKKVEQSWGSTFTNTSNNAKKTADDIKRTILGFDEINKLTKDKDSSSGGGGGSSPYTSGYQYMFEEKELAGGWKDFATAIENAMSDAFSRITMIVGGAELALGAILALSGANVPLGLGLMATGAVTLGSAIFANWEGISKEVKLAVAGVEAAVAGGLAVGAVLAFSGGHVGLGIGLMIAALSTGMGAATIAWNTIGDKMSEKVQAIVTLVGGASFGIGAVLAFAGHPGIGIAMMIAGASVTAVSINWNFLKEKLEGPIGAVTTLISGASLALGILALLSGNIPIGLGLILAGTAGLATTVAANWNNLVNIGKTAIEKVKEGWETVKELVVTAWVELKKKVGEWASDVWEFITNGKETISKKISLIAGSIAEFAGGIWDFVLDAKDTIFKKISLIGGSIADFAGGIWDFVLDTKETVFKKISLMAGSIAEFSGGIWDFVLDTKETIFKKISLMAGSIAEFAGGIWDFVLDTKDTIFKKISLIGGSIADFAGGIWDFVLDTKKTVAKTIQLGMDKAASWVDSIVDFILGPESSDKKANIAMAIENTALAIVNFLRDPVTAIKNVMLELGVKFAQGVEKFWNWITGQDGQSEVTVDAYGNFMIVPKAGEGLTDKGNGQFALTNDVAGTTVLTPEKSDNWQAEWDKLVGGEIPAKVTATVGYGEGTDKNSVLNLFTWGQKVIGTGAKRDDEVSKTAPLDLFTWGQKVIGTGAKRDDEVGKTAPLDLFTWGQKVVGTGAKRDDEVSKTAPLDVFTWGQNVFGTGAKLGDGVKKDAPLSKFSWSKKVSASGANRGTLKQTAVLDLFTWAKSITITAISFASGVLDGIKKKIKEAIDSATKGAGAATGGVIQNGRLTRFESGGIINNGFVRKLPHYAGGTTDAHGTLFVAGEAGPEILGHIGGRTEILNQSQLAATMFAAVRSAMTGVKIGGYIENVVQSDSDEADYEMMYRAMYDAFTDAMAPNAERDREKVALMRQIAAKEFTAEVTANSVNRAQTRMNRRAGTTIVPVGT